MLAAFGMLALNTWHVLMTRADPMHKPTRGPQPYTVRDRWTPRLVAAVLAEAAEEHRRLNQLDSAREVDSENMNALSWLGWLEGDMRAIAFERACGVPWKTIAHARSVDRSTAWRHWTCAMVAIASRLNATSDATPLQHRQTGRQSVDPID